jgi:tetratricopeptide (TPR) repeat protein
MADDAGSAYALNEKTSSLTMLGDLGKAKEACQHSLDLARKSGNATSIVTSLFYKGNIAKLEGNLEEAHKALSEALSAARASADATGSAEVELGLAEVAEEEGHSAEARQQIQEGLVYLQGHKDPGDEISAEILLARIALAEGKAPEAAQAMDVAGRCFGARPFVEGGWVDGASRESAIRFIAAGTEHPLACQA